MKADTQDVSMDRPVHLQEHGHPVFEATSGSSFSPWHPPSPPLEGPVAQVETSLIKKKTKQLSYQDRYKTGYNV